MDKETSQYIIKHYSPLMSKSEKLAWKHYCSEVKLDGNHNQSAVDLYKRVGWMSEDKNVLDLLGDGIECFQERVAERILKSHPDKVFLNYCLGCNRLARTPYAKQCRHCSLDWHDR